MPNLYVMAKVKSKLGETQKAKNILTRLAENSEKESGCLSYQILFSGEDTDTFMTLEVWDSKESEQKHWQEPHLKETLKALEPILAEEPRIEKYQVTSD
ncbi:putative quinol monooxygenase [Microbulbifer sp. THAF38]|uniref:putative quinol monooxygenase n=1 Tax=Microbulbifer sp. THAF38 TaxID=2587856 RepID=UPI0012680041|nr:putative quinol monooxygenase [Microbulbifer sp. THAF38]QFT56530.1 Antibiotic biosynthesis monooxygenase [Microbulbifer sp. THAF38]